MKLYRVREGASRAELEADINEDLKAGAELVGGVTVCGVFRTWENSRKGYTGSETDYTYCQAVLITDNTGGVESE